MELSTLQCIQCYDDCLPVTVFACNEMRFIESCHLDYLAGTERRHDVPGWYVSLSAAVFCKTLWHPRCGSTDYSNLCNPRWMRIQQQQLGATTWRNPFYSAVRSSISSGGYRVVAKEVYIFEPAYSSVNSRLCEAAAFSSMAECKTTGRWWDESVTCCESAGLHGLAWLGLASRNPLCGKGSLQWMRSSHLSASPINKVNVIHRVTTDTVLSLL